MHRRGGKFRFRADRSALKRSGPDGRTVAIAPETTTSPSWCSQPGPPVRERHVRTSEHARNPGASHAAVACRRTHEAAHETGTAHSDAHRLDQAAQPRTPQHELKWPPDLPGKWTTYRG